MHNPTARDTVEIHVYGKDLYGLPRKTWADDGRVSPLVSSKYAQLLNHPSLIRRTATCR